MIDEVELLKLEVAIMNAKQKEELELIERFANQNRKMNIVYYRVVQRNVRPRIRT